MGFFNIKDPGPSYIVMFLFNERKLCVIRGIRHFSRFHGLEPHRSTSAAPLVAEWRPWTSREMSSTVLARQAQSEQSLCSTRRLLRVLGRKNQ